MLIIIGKALKLFDVNDFKVSINVMGVQMALGFRYSLSFNFRCSENVIKC